MTDVEHALSQIADIHAQMAASTRFRGFAPEAVALTGLLALAVAVAQAIWPELLAPDDPTFVLPWIGAAGVAALVVGSEALARSRRLHGRLADALIGSTLRLFLPFGAAGAVLAFVILRLSPESAWLLPGLWQMLVALAGFASVGSLPRAIVWPAGWYFLCGTLVLALASGNAGLSPWLMGVPFALGQGLVALVLHRAGGVDGRR